jgi:hypothetical protein
MKENTREELDEGIDNEYFPSESVTVPLVVPFTTTFTPGKDDPSSADVTLPVITLSCAHTLSTKQNEKHTSKNFFIGFGLG